MADDDYEDMDNAPDGTLQPLVGPTLKTSQDLLPQALVEAAVDPATIEDWRTRAGLCLVIKAPSAEWVAPLEQYLKLIGDWNVRLTRTSKNKASEEAISTLAVQALSFGNRVLGLSQNPAQYLPPAMVTAADQTVELEFPTSKVIAKVIQQVTGEVPHGLTDVMLARLSFGELAACIRRNSTAAQCVARIERASLKKTEVDSSAATAPLIEDLFGYGLAKSWALDLIADLEAWRRGEIEFEQIDRHAVLCGAPGLGKTQFARSLSRSTGLPLIATSMSKWFADGPGYLDSVVKQIDATFATARAAAPALLFIDELDAIPDRATLSPKFREWWTPVVAHLLTTLDGVTSGLTSKLVILGATNYIERIDSALLRPGRLTRTITVELPDEEDIVGILRHYLSGELSDVDLTPIAQLGQGATGAEIMQWLKDARRISRRENRSLTVHDLMVVIAPEKKRPLHAALRVATHEAGHAIAAHFLGYRVEAISLRSSGSNSAYVRLGIDDPVVYSREDLEHRVVQLLSGRAAEEALLGSPGVGAGGSSSSDLALATQIIGQLHLGLGLGQTLIYRADNAAIATTLDRHPGLAAAVEAELQQLYSDALALVHEHSHLIRLVAKATLKGGYLTGSEFLELINRGRE